MHRAGTVPSHGESKPLPKPGYTTSPPVLTAVREMRSYGGFQDACVTLAEVALRRLMDDAQASPQGVRAYVAASATRYGLCLGLDDFDKYVPVLAGVYIVQAYQVCERFLKSLNSQLMDVRQIPRNEWKSQDAHGRDLSPLQQFAENLPRKQASALRKVPEYDLLEYYRLARTCLIHPTADTLKSANKAQSAVLKSHQQHFEDSYGGLSAPNSPDKLTWNDYFLATRAMKYFSSRLNEAARVTIEEVSGYLARSGPVAKSIRRHSQSRPAVRRLVRNWHARLFGPPDEASIEWLLGDLPARLGIRVAP